MGNHDGSCRDQKYAKRQSAVLCTSPRTTFLTLRPLGLLSTNGVSARCCSTHHMCPQPMDVNGFQFLDQASSWLLACAPADRATSPSRVTSALRRSSAFKSGRRRVREPRKAFFLTDQPVVASGATCFRKWTPRQPGLFRGKIVKQSCRVIFWDPCESAGVGDVACPPC